MNIILPMKDDYQFDDSHIEKIYKAIKRLRLKKENYDRVGYILFNYLFNQNIIN